MRNLSVLVHGTDDDKYNWMFDLYDLNADGYISREEMEDVVFSVNISITLVTALYNYLSLMVSWCRYTNWLTRPRTRRP